MATDIGNVYLDVYADTSALKRQIRNAAKKAGKDFGKEFSDEAEKSMAPGLSRLGKQTQDHFKNSGKQSAQEFAKSWNDGIEKHQKDFDIDLDESIRRAGRTGVWTDLFEKFDSLDEATERVNDRLTELGKGGTFAKATGVSIKDLRGQMNAAVKSMRDLGEENHKAALASDANTAAVQRQREELKGWLVVLDDAHRENEDFNKRKKKSDKDAADALSAIREREKQELQGWLTILTEADRENTAFNMRRRKQQADWNAMLTEAIRQNDDYDRSQRALRKTLGDNTMRDAAAEGRVLANSYRDVNEEIQQANRALVVFRKAADNKKQRLQVAQLADSYDEVQREIKQTMATHEVAIRRMIVGSEQYQRQITETDHKITGLKARLATLRNQHLDIEVDVDTPGKVAMTIAGAIDGRAYATGFNAATTGEGFDLFGKLNDSWKTFTTAFPAEVTILMRGILGLASPIATLGSAISGILVAALSSVAVAAGGAALAVAGIGVAAGYAVALAVKSFDVFKERFPAVQAGIDDLKKSFEKIDVPTFAKEWAASLTEFTHTLADSLRLDTVAENLGKATARITEAFTGVLKSAAWTNFVDAIEGPFSTALGDFGVGLASLTGVLLQWMTAAAPIAKDLGEAFKTWAAALDAALGTEKGQQELLRFIDLARQALGIILPLVEDLGAAFGDIFLIGAVEGNRMFGVLGKLAERFRIFTESAAGAAKIGEWFAQAGKVFDHLLPLIGAVGEMLDIMVTPRSIDMLNMFLDSITILLPILGRVFNAFGDLGLLDLFAQALQYIGQIIDPLLPFVDALAIALHDVGRTLLDSLGKALVVVAELLGDLLNVLIPLIAPLGEIVSALVSLDATRMAAGFDALNAAIGPALTGIVDWLDKVIDLAIEAIPQVGLAIAKMIPVILGGLLDLVGALVSGLADALPDLVDVIQEAIPKILNAFADMIPRMFAVWKDVFAVLQKALDETIPKIIEDVQGIGPALVDVIKDNIPVMVAGAKRFFTSLITSLKEIIPELLGIWASIGPTLISAMGTIAITLLQGAVQMWSALAQALIETLPLISETFKNDVLPGIKDLITTAGPEIVTAAVDLFTGFLTGMTEIIGPLSEGMTELIGMIVTTVVDMAPDLLTAATDLFTAMAQAVTDNTEPITQAITDLMPTIQTTLNELLPELTDAAVALFVALATAVTQNTEAITKAINDLMPVIEQVLTDLIPKLVPAGVKLFVALALAVGQSTTEIAAALTAMIGPLTVELTKPENLQKMVEAGVVLFVAIAKATVKATPAIVAALSAEPAKWAGSLASPENIQKFAAVGGDLIGGLVKGVTGSVGKAAAAVGGVIGRMIGTARSLLESNSPSKVFEEIGVDTVLGLINGLDESQAAAHSAVERLMVEVRSGVGNPKESALLSYIQTVGAQLDGTWQQYEDTGDRLKDANRDLKELLADRERMVKSVSGKVTGELDLTAALAKTTKGNIAPGKTGIAGIARIVAQMKAKAGTFNAKMKSLVAMGFSPAFVQMIAGYGLDEAIEIAGALERGTAGERFSIQQDFTDIFKLSDAAGNVVAGQMFDVGIAATEGLVKGLESQEAQLLAAAKNLALILGNQVKASLGIKSPSKLFEDIGHNVMIGLDIGLTESSKDVINTVKAISKDVTSAFAPNAGLNVTAAALGINPVGPSATGNGATAPVSTGTTVAAGAIQIVTPVKDPAIVASMVLDGLVAKAV